MGEAAGSSTSYEAWIAWMLWFTDLFLFFALVITVHREVSPVLEPNWLSSGRVRQRQSVPLSRLNIYFAWSLQRVQSRHVRITPHMTAVPDFGWRWYLPPASKVSQLSFLLNKSSAPFRVFLFPLLPKLVLWEIIIALLCAYVKCYRECFRSAEKLGQWLSGISKGTNACAY